MPSLQEMSAKGARKLQAKAAIMASNYDGAKGLAKTNYAALPFGANTKAAYNTGIDAGRYRTPDTAKWQRNWEHAVSR